MLSKPRSRTIATILAFVGVLTIPGMVGPLAGWHLVGLHKFYLGQPRWGMVYLLLAWTPIPTIASVIEGVWYLLQGPIRFADNFNEGILSAEIWSERSPTFLATSLENRLGQQVEDIASAMRQLDQLREEGLITEYEFEQKRRRLLNQIR